MHYALWVVSVDLSIIVTQSSIHLSSMKCMYEIKMKQQEPYTDIHPRDHTQPCWTFDVGHECFLALEIMSDGLPPWFVQKHCP